MCLSESFQVFLIIRIHSDTSAVSGELASWWQGSLRSLRLSVKNRLPWTNWMLLGVFLNSGSRYPPGSTRIHILTFIIIGHHGRSRWIWWVPAKFSEFDKCSGRDRSTNIDSEKKYVPCFYVAPILQITQKNSTVSINWSPTQPDPFFLWGDSWDNQIPGTNDQRPHRRRSCGMRKVAPAPTSQIRRRASCATRSWPRHHRRCRETREGIEKWWGEQRGREWYMEIS